MSVSIAPVVNYIQFMAPDGKPILIEVESAEITVPRGVEKAGIKEVTQKTVAAAVAIAENTFEETVERIIVQNAQVLASAIQQAPMRPTEMEVSFGIKVTGEIGNAAICKVGSEANYTVKLIWKRIHGPE